MHVRFWGTRGSIPVPGPQTLRYGGNTLCVEVEARDGTRLIFDAGSGIRVLGLHLLNLGPLDAHLFLTHTHWDHIQGFPFFIPAFIKGYMFNVYAPNGGQKGIEEALAGQMEHQYFPVRLADMQSRMAFKDLTDEGLTIGPFGIQPHALHHSGACVGYRLHEGGRSVVYSTDHEPFSRYLYGAKDQLPGEIAHPGDREHVDFLRGADLVIHDAQYMDAEFDTKIGWGHSTVEYAVDVCVAAGVRRLALFHHDPLRSDDQIDQMVAYGQARARAQAAELVVMAAAEGEDIPVE